MNKIATLNNVRPRKGAKRPFESQGRRLGDGKPVPAVPANRIRKDKVDNDYEEDEEDEEAEEDGEEYDSGSEAMMSVDSIELDDGVMEIFDENYKVHGRVKGAPLMEAVAKSITNDEQFKILKAKQYKRAQELMDEIAVDGAHTQGKSDAELDVVDWSKPDKGARYGYKEDKNGEYILEDGKYRKV